MPNFCESKILPHNAEEIFAIVMDIENYPQFLPWCKQAKIVEHISANNLTADLLISFKNIFEKYRSDVKYGAINDEAANGYFVDVYAISGPFKKLINKWQFKNLAPNKCQIDFAIDFEFNSKLLNLMIGGIFESATKKMMSAFEQRAKTLTQQPSNVC